jgi:predicted nucleic acid-binding protein
MNGNFLFDTNILLFTLLDDVSKNYIPVNFKNATLYTSVITRIELLSFQNISIEHETGIKELLTLFQILPLTDIIEKATIQLRRNNSFKVTLPDAIIAASALVVGATLVTNDKQLLKLNWPGLEVRSIFEQN